MSEGRWGIALLLVLSVAGVARAEQPGAKTEGTGDDKTRWAAPKVEAPVLPAQPVKARPLAETPTAPRGYLTLQAVSTKDGEAVIKTADGTRLLKPGDPLGTDVVKEVAEGLIVLQRPAQPGRQGGESTVVVRFDAQGRPQVRIYYAEDPTPVEPPETHGAR
jgi:hypothetical protein